MSEQFREANKIEDKLLEYIQDMIYTDIGLPTIESTEAAQAMEKKYYKRLVKLAYKIVEWRIVV